MNENFTFELTRFCKKRSKSGIAHLLKQVMASPLIIGNQECCNHHTMLKNRLVPENVAGFDCYDRVQYFKYRGGLCYGEHEKINARSYHGSQSVTPPLFQETPPNHGNSEISDISPVDQTGSRAFSVARDKLKPCQILTSETDTKTFAGTS